jgi:hypothetical protein
MPAVFRSYPRLKGILGSSWFLDPSLGKTSPELAFIREITERFGAAPLHLQRVKSLETAAFSLSPTRRQLFESGQYVPNVYALVISKRDIERTLSTGGAT